MCCCVVAWYRPCRYEGENVPDAVKECPSTVYADLSRDGNYLRIGYVLLPLSLAPSHLPLSLCIYVCICVCVCVSSPFAPLYIPSAPPTHFKKQKIPRTVEKMLESSNPFQPQRKHVFLPLTLLKQIKRSKQLYMKRYHGPFYHL